MVIIPLGLMVLLAYFMDKQQRYEPGGETIYMNYCAGCHGKNGDGKGLTARIKRLKPANFTLPEFWLERSDEDILEIITNGKKEMPKYEKFIKESDRKEVIEYLKKKFKPPLETKPRGIN